MKNRPNILTIAGFDPSGGAGLLADIKTIEALKCYGMSVCTANTIQTDREFVACNWIAEKEILQQLEIILTSTTFDIVKIGIIESWDTLLKVIALLKMNNPKVRIVWDPILSSSTNFEFHKENDKQLIEQVLDEIYLVTPNYKEIQQLFPDHSIEEAIQNIQEHTNLYLKGGHRLDAVGKDELFTKDEKKYTLNPKMQGCTEKHGSGCVLSSAIAAHLALDFPLLKACYRGKRYTEKVLVSNKSLLGYHRI